MLRTFCVAAALTGCASLDSAPSNPALSLLRGATDTAATTDSGTTTDTSTTGTTTTDTSTTTTTGTTDTAAEASSGFMTGGGSLFAGDIRVTHGFRLVCDPLDGPQRLQVNWQGHRFHLTEVTSVVCTDDPLLDPGNPDATFDTLSGSGIGRLDGVDGVVVDFTFTDDGEPGVTDAGEILVAGGTAVAASSLLDRGNHQAHGGPTDEPDDTGLDEEDTDSTGTEETDPQTFRVLGAGCSTSPAVPSALGVLLAGLLLRRRQGRWGSAR